MSPVRFPSTASACGQHSCPRLLIAVLLCVIFAVALLAAGTASAKAVISEVHWAGSDLSTSDEWLEISDSGSSPSLGSELAGWTLTSVNSSGNEVVLFTFPAGTVINPGAFMVISRFGGAQSRLLSEPAFTVASISLPNTKLLLRLRDDHGQIVDEVDDGVGNPFAGENTSAPVHKSSMERVDLAASGTDAANWITAARSVGLDDGAPISGTPGFPRLDGLPANSSSSVFSSSVSSLAASSSSLSSVASVSSASQASLPVSSSSSSAQTSCPAFDPYISLQSGVTVAEEKVTLNVQILQRYGSLGSAVCSVDFGDGTVMPSCNPSSHSYDRVGSYTIRADVKSSCGETLTRTLAVSVLPKGGTVSSSPAGDADSSQIPASDQPSGGLPDPNNRIVRAGEKLVADRWPVSADRPGGGFILSGVLPNPPGKDSGKEWVEISNGSAGTANLEGWSLRLPHAKKGKFTFGTVGFGSRESKRFSDTALGMIFGNTSGELSLVDPSGAAVSTLTWKDVRDGVVVKPPVTQRASIKARVTHVLDGDTMDVIIPGTVDRTERVRLIGIDAPELHSSDPTQVMLGKRAGDFLRQLVTGEEVTLAQGPDERDAYGRLLAYVQTRDGDLLQEIILREGLASVYLKFPFAREAEFLEYQQEAQEVLAGIWSVLGIAQRSQSVAKKEEQIMYSNILTANAVPVQMLPVISADSLSDLESDPEPVLVSVPGTLTSTVESKKKASSSKKSTAKKKSASPARRSSKSGAGSKKAKAPAKKKSSSSKKSAGPEFTPLHSSMTPELLALNALIENPDGDSLDEEVIDDVPAQQFPFMTLGVALSGAVSAGGGAGWVLAKRRRE